MWNTAIRVRIYVFVCARARRRGPRRALTAGGPAQSTAHPLHEYSPKSDIWSLGIVLFIMLCGCVAVAAGGVVQLWPCVCGGGRGGARADGSSHSYMPFDPAARDLYTRIRRSPIVFQAGTPWDKISVVAKDFVRAHGNSRCHMHVRWTYGYLNR